MKAFWWLKAASFSLWRSLISVLYLGRDLAFSLTGVEVPVFGGLLILTGLGYELFWTAVQRSGVSLVQALARFSPPSEGCCCFFGVTPRKGLCCNFPGLQSCLGAFALLSGGHIYSLSFAQRFLCILVYSLVKQIITESSFCCSPRNAGYFQKA